MRLALLLILFAHPATPSEIQLMGTNSTDGSGFVTVENGELTLTAPGGAKFSLASPTNEVHCVGAGVKVENGTCVPKEAPVLCHGDGVTVQNGVCVAKNLTGSVADYIERLEA